MKTPFNKIIVILSFVLTFIFITSSTTITASNGFLNSDKKSIVIQAEDLIKEYNENPKAADEKYEGKMLTVAGRVAAVQKFPKPSTISIHTNLDRDPADKSKLQEVGCVLDKSEKFNLDGIILSQRIMTTGRNVGVKPSELMKRDDNAESEYIALENCRIEIESSLNDSTKVDSNKMVGLPDASSGKIPSDAELQVLLRTTIQTFADALESGDFTKFRVATATVSVLHTVTSERLKEVYGGQKYNLKAYRWAIDKKVKLFRPPVFTEYRQSTVGSKEFTSYTSLNLIGNYEEWTSDSHKIVEFSLQYLAEGKDWKLLVINELKPLETDYTKPTNSASNIPPQQQMYAVPENLADLITSDAIFKSFAAEVRPDLEEETKNSGRQFHRELAMLDLQEGKLDSALLHIKKIQELKKELEKTPGALGTRDLFDSEVFEVVIKTLQKSGSVNDKNYQKNFLKELKKVLDRLSYRDRCVTLGKIEFMNAFGGGKKPDFEASLEKSFGEEAKANGNKVGFQTALDLIEARTTIIYIVPMIELISKFMNAAP